MFLTDVKAHIDQYKSDTELGSSVTSSSSGSEGVVPTANSPEERRGDSGDSEREAAMVPDTSVIAKKRRRFE